MQLAVCLPALPGAGVGLLQRPLSSLEALGSGKFCRTLWPGSFLARGPFCFPCLSYENNPSEVVLRLPAGTENVGSADRVGDGGGGLGVECYKKLLVGRRKRVNAPLCPLPTQQQLTALATPCLCFPG